MPGGPLLQGPAVGLPVHLPGEAGEWRGLPRGQAGELGLVQEPEALGGWGQQVDAGGLGVVLTVCGEGEERCGGLGGGGGVEGWPAAPARPQASPLPRDPWTLLLPELQRAGVCPPLGWGLACKQAVSSAPKSTPHFFPLSQGTDLCRGPLDMPVSGLLSGCGWWPALWRVGGVRVSSRRHRRPGLRSPHILSPRGGRHLRVSSTSVRSSALALVGPWLPAWWLRVSTLSARGPPS